jgi:UDP:flavonoid glycosyltransferase YjiC (YdhE family)
MSTFRRPRILFVAEAVTLAHFARPVALAKALDPRAYDIWLASDPRYLELAGESPPFQFRAIASVSSAQFRQKLAGGKPLYDEKTLESYIKGDLELLNEVRPDLVVGDFRLSLAVSAPLAKVPYANLINAYWSPYAKIRYVVPELPLVRLVGPAVGQRLFDLVKPFAFAAHSLPLNRLRRRYGLPTPGLDLRRVYSWGDYTLYPDVPDAVPMSPLPDNHFFLGPVFWSPEIEMPVWWEVMPKDRPVVYVTLGSSGKKEVLAIVLEALADAPVTVMASTSGHPYFGQPPANAFVANYLPGDKATARADLVISNGGSLTTSQALACGVPVLGLADNMDQFLNMLSVERLGAGITLRAGSANPSSLRRAVHRLLGGVSWKQAAKVAAEAAAQYDNAKRFGNLITDIL